MNTPRFSDIEEMWPSQLEALLRHAAVVQDIKIKRAPWLPDDGYDGLAEFRVEAKKYQLLIECKSSGQPRYVRDALSRIPPEKLRSQDCTSVAVFVAPFVSPASRVLLAENNWGWLDLAGNARFAFPDFYLEIDKTSSDPFASKREQRSLYFPKSARVLKLLLLHPHRTWKVAELVEAAGVSAGQVSNVRKALIECEWAQTNETAEGIHLTQPDALLDAWSNAHAYAPKAMLRAHTLLHGRPLEAAIEAAFTEASDRGTNILMASHSVARRLAPFARIAGEYFYVDRKAVPILTHHLELKPTDKGENVTLFETRDDGIWLLTMEVGSSSIKGTDSIQTYLDLLGTGERGREAAAHWRAEKISPLLRHQP